MACIVDNLCCGDLPQAFGFVNGTKWRACEVHTLTLIHKQAIVYEIAAFTFIQTPRDGALYEERRNLRPKGLGNVTSMALFVRKTGKSGRAVWKRQ